MIGLPIDGESMASIGKRSWTLKDGTSSTSYRVSYKDPKGKWKRKDFKLRREASSFVQGLKTHDHTDTKTVPTVAKAAEYWLDVCEHVGRKGRPPVETSTLNAYKGHVHNHIVPRLGASKVTEVTPQVIHELVRDMLSDLSRPLARKVLISLGAILAECKLRGYLVENPCANITIRINSGRHKQEVDTPSKEIVLRILSHSDSRASSTNR